MLAVNLSNQVETLQGLEREVARLQAEVFISWCTIIFLIRGLAIHLKIGCNIPHCILISWQICGGDSFNFHFHFHLSGGPVEKRGGGGEEEKLKPGGALQEHRAGNGDDVKDDDCEDCDDDAAIRMVIMTSLQLSRSWRIGSQFSKPSCAMRKIGARLS